jgi:hypothetical protein
VCRAQAYWVRDAADRALRLGLMLADAKWNGDTGRITFVGGGRRHDALLLWVLSIKSLASS